MRSTDATFDHHELLLELDAIVADKLDLLDLESLVLFVVVGDRLHVGAAVRARALRAESHLVRLLGAAARERERLLRVSSGSDLVLLDLANRKLAAASRSRASVRELSPRLEISRSTLQGRLLVFAVPQLAEHNLLLHHTVIVVIRETIRESPAADSGASRPLGSLNRAALDSFLLVSWSPLPDGIFRLLLHSNIDDAFLNALRIG